MRTVIVLFATHVEKRLSPRLAGESEARRQLETEAAVLHALAGRGAPRLHARGEDARGPWLHLERIHLPTLSEIAKAARTPDDWARTACALFDALSAIHDASDDAGPLGIVHGDISPANAATAEDGSAAILLDFGLSSGRDWPRPDGGEFRGTVQYAAPEVARAEPFDARADVFALAASLLHAASGNPPRATSLPAAIAQAAEMPLDAWAEEAALSFPPAARAVLVRSVAFDPRERPRARDVAAMLGGRAR